MLPAASSSSNPGDETDAQRYLAMSLEHGSSIHQIDESFKAHREGASGRAACLPSSTNQAGLHWQCEYAGCRQRSRCR